jgi:hypothetical protein
MHKHCSIRHNSAEACGTVTTDSELPNNFHLNQNPQDAVWIHKEAGDRKLELLGI